MFSKTTPASVPHPLLLLITFFFISRACFSQNPLSTYDSAAVMPPFTYYQLNNNVFTPDSIANGTNTVMIYIKKDCGYCEEQGRIIAHVARKAKNTQFIFIAREDSAFIAHYAATHGLRSKNVQLLKDPLKLYYTYANAAYTPSLHIYNKDRKMIAYHEGVLLKRELLNYLK